MRSERQESLSGIKDSTDFENQGRSKAGFLERSLFYTMEKAL